MVTALLAGVAAVIFLGGGKRKSRSSKSKSKEGMAGEIGDTAPPRAKWTLVEASLTRKISGEPWAWCKSPEGSPKGTHAAFSKDGKECMVFWKPDTKDAVRQLIQSELAKLPKDKRDALCKIDECKPDPFAPDPMAFCEWIPNPDRIDFVKKIVLALWPQIDADSLPTKEDSPYFVKVVWDQTGAIFARDFCGFGLVT